MRPSLSPLEYGAYGTPSRVVSVEVGGPQVSEVGRADKMSTRFIGAMIARRVCDVVRSWGKPEGRIASIFVKVRVVVFSGALEILAVSDVSRGGNLDASKWLAHPHRHAEIEKQLIFHFPVSSIQALYSLLFLIFYYAFLYCHHQLPTYSYPFIGGLLALSSLWWQINFIRLKSANGTP